LKIALKITFLTSDMSLSNFEFVILSLQSGTLL